MPYCNVHTCARARTPSSQGTDGLGAPVAVAAVAAVPVAGVLAALALAAAIPAHVPLALALPVPLALPAVCAPVAVKAVQQPTPIPSLAVAVCSTRGLVPTCACSAPPAEACPGSSSASATARFTPRRR